jgi:hypothetical protein
MSRREVTLVRATISGFLVVSALAAVAGCSSSTTSSDKSGSDPGVDAGGGESAAAADSGASGNQDSATSVDANVTPPLDAGSGDLGSATLTGLPAGAVPRDATAFNKAGKLTIKITDYVGACALESANNAHKKNSTYLEIYLGTYPGTAGSFTVGSTVDVEGWKRDATCQGTGTPATAGNVTVATLTASEITGTLSVTLGGTTIAGSFRAPVCEGGAVVGTGGACVP